jgi:hypothetical protein
MPTINQMTTSLDDAQFFNDKIEQIVRGPESGHDVEVIRRYFRGYLHCWKTVLHFVRKAKGLGKKDWINWCQRWQTTHLDKNGIESMNQLRETRDYDTHTGTIIVSGEVAAGLFALVFVGPVAATHVRRELVTLTKVGLEVAGALIATHATFV